MWNDWLLLNDAMISMNQVQSKESRSISWKEHHPGSMLILYLQPFIICSFHTFIIIFFDDKLYKFIMGLFSICVGMCLCTFVCLCLCVCVDVCIWVCLSASFNQLKRETIFIKFQRLGTLQRNKEQNSRRYHYQYHYFCLSPLMSNIYNFWTWQNFQR